MYFSVAELIMVAHKLHRDGEIEATSKTRSHLKTKKSDDKGVTDTMEVKQKCAVSSFLNLNFVFKQ